MYSNACRGMEALIVIQHKTPYSPERKGIITDYLKENDEFVVLWDTDESISLDKHNKKCYNCFDPVSLIPASHLVYYAEDCEYDVCFANGELF